MDDLALPGRSSAGVSLRALTSSDEVLAKLVARGSTRAFALLYRRHHQALYRYARAIVHNEQDAEDVLQSAMLRALRALQSRERDLAVRPWLFRIAHNEAVSLLRRRGRDARLVQQLEPPGDAVESPIESRERIATLLADLTSLTERQRSALVMHELSGLSNGEIAAVLAISPGAAKQAVFEARCALQALEEGREMDCDHVRRLISEGDRRVLRGRRLGGHLRACADCREFQSAIATRNRALQALAPPLPAAAAALILERVALHSLGSSHAAGVAGASRLALGKTGVASLGVKGLAGAAVVVVAAAGGARVALRATSHAHLRAGAPALHARRLPLTSSRAAPAHSSSVRDLAPDSTTGRRARPAASPGDSPARMTSAPALSALGSQTGRRSSSLPPAGGGLARGHAQHGAPAGLRHPAPRVARPHQGLPGGAAHSSRPRHKEPVAGRRAGGAPAIHVPPGAGQRQGPQRRETAPVLESAVVSETPASAP